MGTRRLFWGLLAVALGVAGGLLAARAYQRYRVLEEHKLAALDRVLASQERLAGIIPLKVVSR